jgi:hypothetical protein
MLPIVLSRAFQTALGILTTNSVTARRFIAGEIRPSQLHAALTEEDIEGLQDLLNRQADRVVAVSEMLTSRRKRRVTGTLPVTVRMLGERFEAWWSDYLRSCAPCGLRPAAGEAQAFAGWALLQLERQSAEFELIRYELYRSDVASRFLLRESGAGKVGVGPGSEHRRLRLASCARVERFEWAVDEAIMRFRRTGEISGGAQGDPVHLIFHAVSGRVAAVGVTKVSPAMSLVLERSGAGVELRELLLAVPEAMRPHMLVFLERLIDMQVVDVE